MYDHVADLPLVVDDHAMERRAAETSSGFERVTTVVSLEGDGHVGHGEDVSYDAEDHPPLRDADFDLAGEYTLDSFSTMLEDVDLWPEPAARESSVEYRRWAFESAALDLALRQADTDLAGALGRPAQPVRFVVSTRLDVDGDGDEVDPTADRVTDWLDVDPTLEFKLDPTPAWDDDLVTTLAETGAVRVLDFKGLYESEVVRTEADPALYRRVVEGFPDALLEDPRLTDETEPLFEGRRARVSWDYPIHGIDDVEALPFEPKWLNVKPSRFGTVESLFETIAHCEREGVAMYGGGQFELDVGRTQLHALAAACYPDAPNDVAPRAYNRPEPTDDVTSSPLEPPADPVGFGGGWG